MLKYQQKFIDRLEKEDIKYKVDNHIVDVRYGGDNAESIRLLLLFDKEDNALLQVVSIQVVSFKEEQYAAAMKACNALNAKYRWAKFYLDDDGDIRAEADAILTDADGDSIALELMLRMVNIIDEAYKDLMRVKLDL